ncbi:hypothetical protein MAR_006307 [Mya arenaria]|uniref:Uncharacterized protein n=1 Tax=Mya arenaria TaxID=6604 RepID=A0ABY7D9S2_MYAAR|nr:hypothetical protein MAR_006307 [Mya arenaria]
MAMAKISVKKISPIGTLKSMFTIAEIHCYLMVGNIKYVDIDKDKKLSMSVRVEEERLNNLLRRFYSEVAPQEKKSKSAELQLKVYRKNTMKNIRAALNRHLSDIGSNIDIVHGQLFKSANRTLNGLLKTQIREGLSIPTKHKSIISNGDLSRLADYIRRLLEILDAIFWKKVGA